MTTPALTDHLARQFRVQIDLSTTADADWQYLKGVNTFQPKYAATFKDNSDYDSEGEMTQAKVASTRGAMIKLSVKGATAAQMHPTQAKLKACADDYSGETTAMVHFRYFDRAGGLEAVEGRAHVQWDDDGGAVDALRTASVNLIPVAKWDKIANPVTAAAAVPLITSVTPLAGQVAGGQQVIIKGRGFTGTVAVTGVKFAGTNSPQWTVLDDATIVAVTPAHAAGAGPVLVTNATGPSTTGPTFTFA